MNRTIALLGLLFVTVCASSVDYNVFVLNNSMETDTESESEYLLRIFDQVQYELNLHPEIAFFGSIQGGTVDVTKPTFLLMVSVLDLGNGTVVVQNVMTMDNSSTDCYPLGGCYTFPQMNHEAGPHENIEPLATELVKLFVSYATETLSMVREAANR